MLSFYLTRKQGKQTNKPQFSPSVLNALDRSVMKFDLLRISGLLCGENFDKVPKLKKKKKKKAWGKWQVCLESTFPLAEIARLASS